MKHLNKSKKVAVLGLCFLFAFIGSVVMLRPVSVIESQTRTAGSTGAGASDGAFPSAQFASPVYTKGATGVTYTYGTSTSGGYGDTQSQNGVYHRSSSSSYLGDVQLQDYRNGGAAADWNGIGTWVWSNPERALTVDNWCAWMPKRSGITHYLYVYNWGFSIPSSATITGIMVRVYRQQNGAGNYIVDYSDKLGRYGIGLFSAERSSGSQWNLQLAWEIFGYSSDLWGYGGWTPADFNTIGYGSIAFDMSARLDNAQPYVDCIQMRVFYRVTYYRLDMYYSFRFTEGVRTNVSKLGWGSYGRASTGNLRIYLYKFSTSAWADTGLLVPTSDVLVSQQSVSVTDYMDPNGYMYIRYAFYGSSSSFYNYVDYVYWTVSLRDDVKVNIRDIPSGDTLFGNVLLIASASGPFSTLTYQIDGITGEQVTRGTNSWTDNSTVGAITWSNPALAQSSDNSYAMAVGATTGGTDYSHYLRGVNFSFSVSGTILGISVSVERHRYSAIGTSVSDFHIYLLKAGNVAGSDKARTGISWETSDTAVNYGSSADLWGTTWSANDVNGGNFGVVLSARLDNSQDLPAAAEVDYIAITVYYLGPKTLTQIGSTDRFEAFVNTAGIPPGAHTLYVQAKFWDGTVAATDSVSINVVNSYQYELFFEIDYITGHPPTQAALDYMKCYWSGHAINVSFRVDDNGGNGIPSPPSWMDPYGELITEEEFWTIEGQYNDVWKYNDSARGNPANAKYDLKEKWVLYGTYWSEDDSDPVIGLCGLTHGPCDSFGNYIFMCDSFIKLMEQQHQIPNSGLEVTVLCHEAGHSVGILVWGPSGEFYDLDQYSVMSLASTMNSKDMANYWYYSREYWITANLTYYLI